MKTRQLGALAVVLTTEVVGTIAIAIGLVIDGSPPPGGSWWIYAVLAGNAGLVGLACFYRGLASGVMGVVAPISATSVAIPVVAGIALGDRLSGLQGIGMAVAVTGVILASLEGGSTRHADGATSGVGSGAGLALVAALGFGMFFLLFGQAADQAGAFWAALVSRGSASAVAILVALAVSAPLRFSRADVPVLLLIGLLDVAANIGFALASIFGLLSVAAVLASLYPVVTVLLARLVLHERVRPVQRLGSFGALAGAALIAAG